MSSCLIFRPYIQPYTEHHNLDLLQSHLGFNYAKLNSSHLPHPKSAFPSVFPISIISFMIQS